jgi:hypothetical protein
MIAVVAGPIAWFCAHVASWMLAPGAHEHASLAGLWIVDLAALAVCLAAAIASGIHLRRLHAVDPADRVFTRAHFISGAGLVLSLGSALLVIALMAPLVLLVPGAEP